MNRMPEAGDLQRGVSILEKAEIIFSDHRREAWKNADFLEAFRSLSARLSGAYHVSDNIYSQTASSLRLEQGASINRAKEFLNYVDYNPKKAEDIVKDFAKTHKPIKVYLGRDLPINLGVNIGSDELLSLRPESKASGRSSTIATLAQQAARLESLLAPEGIPEAYATAQGQVGQALKVVEKAALLAYDWNTNWGRLNVENALDHAKSVLTKQKITKTGLAIALSLAGCDGLPPIQIVTPDVSTPPAITQTVEPSREPTAYNPAETQTPPVESTYYPPSVEDVTFLPDSGGGVDRTTIINNHSIRDEVLKGYEDTGYELAAQSGFQKNDLDINYVEKGEHWNIFFRVKSTGEVLWSYRISDNAMASQPVIWYVDGSGIVHPDTKYQLRQIAGSKDSSVVYTPSGFLVEAAKPIVLPDGSTLFTQWRSVFTDELAYIPGAAEALNIKLVDGAPTIDRYDTPEAENIVLTPESIKTIETTDGLNPNILTGQDAAGNKYAFNPDHGWFQLPEVQLDYNKLEAYTQVTQAFIEDGRANITTALLYAENPTISPDAIDPVYWVGYNNNVKIPMLCNNACGLSLITPYQNEVNKMYYNATNKPFAWTGFYYVQLNNGEFSYMPARTLRNPSDTNPNQTINLFYGFDKKNYERMYNNVLGDGITTELKMLIEGTDKGGSDIAVVLVPPVRFADGTDIFYDPTISRVWHNYYNPTISGLQTRGQLISLFNNPGAIMDVIRTGQQQQVVVPLTEPIPKGFSKVILFSGFINR